MALLKRVLCTICFAVCLTGFAQDRSAHEYELKAVFLYNFAKLTDWPATAFAGTNSPIVIGVLGKNPFGSSLNAVVKNKRIGEREILVQRFKQAEDARHCHILFVSDSEKEHLADILTVLARQPVLSVSDLDGFAERGGMIQLIKDGEYIRFAINTAAAERAGLTLSSQLLQLATIVRPRAEGN